MRVSWRRCCYRMKNITLILLGLLMMCSVASHAAIITWGSNTSITGNTSELITNANVVVNDFTQLTPPSFDFYTGPTSGATTSYGFSAADYQSFLSSINFNNSNVINLTGLNEGQTYDVQVFYTDQRGPFDSRTMQLDGGPVLSALGEYAIGNFVADATGTQTIVVTPGGGTSSLHLSGYILATVPEPSFVGILFFGTAGLLCARRKKRCIR